MADFYIRSWDPDSTYPPNPQEGDVCYTITLDQSWAPVAGVKNDNLVKTEIYTSGNWVEQGGGGGGGDYKTVSVTLIPYNENDIVSLYAWTNDDGSYQDMFVSENGFLTEISTGEAGQISCPLVLSGNSGMCSLYGAYRSSTGSVVYDEDENAVTISGDCTITLEATD